MFATPLIARLRQPRAWSHVAAWLLPLVAYAGVAVYWHARDAYRLTGDEPHYLVIAESLVADGDLDPANNYAVPGGPPDGARHTVTSSNGTFSIHNIGLPLLLLVPYSLGGPLGARLGMELLVSLAPLVVYDVLRRELGSSGVALLMALTLALGMPFLDGANQVYPDMLTGCLVFFAASRLWRPSAKPGLTEDVCFALSLALLPWLHIKNILPAMILLAGRVALAPAARGAAGQMAGQSPGRGRLRRLAPGIALGASLALLAAYNTFAFGRFQGPYSTPGSVAAFALEPATNLKVFLGLHWDQAQGMFLQQPLLLLGLLGLVPLLAGERQAARAATRGLLGRATWRDKFQAWRRPVFLGLLYASLIGPNCLHPAWYGGFSFAGRFAWSSVLLWVFPLAHALRMLMGLGRWLAPTLCGAGLALQVGLAQTWLRHDAYLLYSVFPAPAWAYTGLYHPRARMRLPYWRHFPDFWEHPSNVAFLLIGAAVIAAGWMLCARRRGLAACLVSAFTLAALVVSPLPARDSAWTLPIEKSWAQTGEIRSGLRLARQGHDPRGYLAIWPINCLPRGDYALSLQYESRGADAAEAGAWDVVLDHRVWKAGQLPCGPPPPDDRQMEFCVPTGQDRSPVEIRVRYEGHGDLSVTQATLNRLPRR